MDNQYKGKDISFETLEKAVNGDYFAMQEVIRLFKPYISWFNTQDEVDEAIRAVGQLAEG